jgi:CubicO group peptidase (beta-lactamase class C family)
LSETAADVRGRVADGFEAVREVFAETLDGSPGGAAFAAVVDGRPVVDLWGGVADPGTGAAWGEDTAVTLFSGTKGLIAACMLILVERGLIDLDAPVVRYWPEFAAGGKESVLVRHVLSHTAGVPGLRRSFSADDVVDEERMVAAVAEEPPFWPPGETLAYHALTYGWICSELIRRVDGRSAGRFVAEELAAPLRLEVWLGLPAELDDRVANLVPRPNFGMTVVGEEPAPLLDAVFGQIHGFQWNEPSFRRVEIPGGNAVGTARSLARFYGCLARGGELDGVRLLAPETVELGGAELARGTCAVTRRPYAYGAGFELWTELGRLGPARDAFGHTGSGGSTHGAWPGRKTGFSYATSDLVLESDDRRGADLLGALWAATA